MDLKAPDFYFRHYNVDNGLSQNSVTSVFQDHIGFIWLGTKEGLNRFDGKSFRYYKVSRLDTISIGNSFIRSIIEYKDRHFLIGTDKGLYLFDMEMDIFSQFTAVTKHNQGIKGPISSIIVDQEGKIWIASLNEGLFYYDPKTDELLLYEHNPLDPYSISSNKVSVVYQDSRGIIWAGTREDGLNKFSKETRYFIKYDINSSPYAVSGNNINCIYEDSNENLWIGTQAEGLNLLDRGKGIFRHFSFHIENKRKGINSIKVINSYNDDQLLIGTEEGLILFDPGLSSYTVYSNNPSNHQSLGSNTVNSILRDSEGSFWIGTQFGGVAFLPENLKNISHFYPDNTRNSIKGKIIREFVEDKSGNIWVATEDEGLFYFDTQNNDFKQFYNIPSQNSISHHNTRTLLLDNDKLWIGLYSKGIDILDMKTGKFRNYLSNDSLKNALIDDYVNKIYRDASGTIWIGTGNGLCTYDYENDAFISVKNPILNESNVQDILQDSFGFIWVGTYGSGIFRHDPGKNQWHNYRHISDDSTSAFSNIINCIYQDKDGILWFGSEDSRIFFYDYENDEFYTDQYLFGSLNSDAVLSIIDDEIGNLWIGSNRGLFRYNPKIESKVYLFQHSDGFQSTQFNYRSAFIDSNGKLYFGGINGFNSFYPEDIKINTFVPPVIITSLKLFNEEIPVNTDNSALSRSALFTNEVVFNHKQSVIGIEFVGLSYMLPEKNRYDYMLEGYNNEWLQLHNHNEVSFSNLEPGSYTFLVRASNNDGVYNEEPVALALTILPPFWRTTWAYVLYSFLLALSLFLFALYLERSATLKNRERIKELNLQKEKEITNLKIDFFTNIAHEIKTPLMLINGPIERLISKREGPIEDIEEFQLINKNVNRLFKLVNQLLDFRKIDKKFYKLNYRQVNIIDLIQDLFISFTRLAKQKEIDFVFRSNVSYYNIDLDQEVVIKAVGNLLTNAFKFTKDRIEVFVFIPKEAMDSPGKEKYIELSVTDNGIGIEKDKLDTIFNPFYQVNENRRNNTPITGIGLGLSYTKSLVELHNGKIIVESEIGRGSNFTIQIPVLNQLTTSDPVDDSKDQFLVNVQEHIADDLSNEILTLKDDAGEIIIKSGNPEILIVEDNSDLRMFLRKHFSNQYNISLASNGMEATGILKEHDFDLIISDIMMPEMDGIEFCKNVKNNFETSHIPIIVFTAKTTLETKIASTEIGADAYVEKPFSLKYISVLIKNILENRSKLKTRFSQLPFSKTSEIISSQADKKFLDKINEIIHSNIENPEFMTEELAIANNISRSSLHKKLKAISGVTPNDYIKIIKLKKAAELIMNSDYQINEVCYMVGFNTPSYFSKCFHDQFGVLPSEFRK